MKTGVWLLVLGCLGGIGFLCWRATNAWQARRRSEEERFAAFMGVAKTSAAPAPASPAGPAIPTNDEKLLFESAGKAGEAGEPELAIQLYGRLLERFPASLFAGRSRTAIEALKAKG